METSEEENQQIVVWQEENITNVLIYKRLQKVCEREMNPVSEFINKEENIIWKKIITKILAEEV